MRPLALTIVLGALALSGCGSEGADLFVASRSGSIPGARLKLRTIDDGRVVCNGTMHELDSHDLILSRVLAQDLHDYAKKHTRLPPGHPSILRFGIRTADGDVAFSDTSPGQPPVFFRAAQLIRAIARGPCGLPR